MIVMWYYYELIIIVCALEYKKELRYENNCQVGFLIFMRNQPNLIVASLFCKAYGWITESRDHSWLKVKAAGGQK